LGLIGFVLFAKIGLRFFGCFLPTFFLAGYVNSKAGIIILIMILLMNGNPASASLLFDGTIQASDHRNGSIGSSMAGYGAYNYWYCIPQTDSITTVPAPGGRSGYAIRVKAIPGKAGDCGSDQHLQITAITHGMPTLHKDVWIGWSTMLDPSWRPQGAGAWEHFGIQLPLLNFKLSNSGLYTDIGTSDTSISVLNNIRFSSGSNVLSSKEHTKGVWHDWMFHVKWTFNNTGFIELYHKTEAEKYNKIYSIYNVPTLNPLNPMNDFTVRAGLYRSSLSKSTQIFYSQGIKIGTTKEDVEFGGPNNGPANYSYLDPFPTIMLPNPYATTDPGTTPEGAPFESAPKDFDIIIAVFAIIGIVLSVYLNRGGNFKK
jgi:hypothetical protein